MKHVCGVLIFVTLCVAQQGRAVAQVTPVSLDSVRALALDSIPGAAVAYFRPADRARAAELQSLLAEYLEFYREHIGIDVRMRVAVLSSQDWARLTMIPYGLPNNSGPGTGNLLLAATSPPERIGSREMPGGRTGDLLLIGHEGGHLLIWELMPVQLKEGLTSPDTPQPEVMQRLQNVGSIPLWYMEMAANYLTTAFVKARSLDDADAWHAHLQAITEIAAPRYTHLGDWMSLLQAVAPDSTPYVFSVEGGLNQGWYQGVVGLAAAHIYEHAGLTFVEHIRSVVSGNAAPSTDELAQQLESIAPGITDLLASLGAKWSKPD
jgi:hypothetical protein